MERTITKLFLVTLCLDAATNLLVATAPTTQPQQQQQQQQQQSFQQDTEVPINHHQEPQFNEEPTIHKEGIPYIITIQYCNRSSLHGTYENLKRTIYMKFPNKNIELEGLDYPVPSNRATLAQWVTYAQYGVMGLSFFYQQIFTSLGMAVPPIVQKIAEKKMIVVMGVFFLAGQLNNYLMASGGFAVMLDGNRIYEAIGGNVDFEQVIRALEARIQ